MSFRLVVFLWAMFVVMSAGSDVSAVTVQQESDILPNGVPYLWIEGEDFLEKQDSPGDEDAVGWVWVSKDAPMLSIDAGDFGDFPILPEDTNASGGEAIQASRDGSIINTGEATWQLQFQYPGTYYMYLHWSFYSVNGNSDFKNEDSLYVPPDFNKNPYTDWIGHEGVDWTTGDPRVGTYERDGYIDAIASPGTLVNVVSKGDSEVHNDTSEEDFWYGNFHWFWIDRSTDYNEQGEWQGFNGFEIFYEVTDDMVGQTLDFQIGRREPYGTIDGILFAQDKRLLKRAYTQEELSSLIFVEDPGLACDVNGDGSCDAADIDAMTQMVLDGSKTLGDRAALIESPEPDGFNTYIGDSDLNGSFDEQDIVAAFISGKYLSGQSAGWSDGDWNGDFLFSEQDFVSAFIAGGYLQPPRGAVSSVPEPSGLLLLLIGLLGVARRRR